MKTSKKILSVLLSVLLALLSLSAGAAVFAADGMGAYGPCGDNINWDYTAGVLTISGQGVLSAQVVQYPVDSLSLNTATGELETTVKTLNVRLFPWYPALEDQLGKKYGYSGYPELKNALNAGMVNAKNYYRDLYSVIRSIVIEEGVTAIPEGAFSTALVIPYLPRTVSLPASLISLNKDALNTGLAEKIVIANPTFVPAHSIMLSAFSNADAAVSSPDQLLNTNAMAAAHDAETARFLASVFLVMNDAKQKRDQKKEAANLMEDPQEKATALAKIQAEETALVELASKYLFTRSATADGTIKELLARVNAKLGTELAANEIGTFTSAEFDEEGTLLTAAQFSFSAAVQAKLDALNTAAADAAAATSAATDALTTYYLGEAPQAGTTPAAWVTVYGNDGSTAQSAATTSGVKFSALSTYTPADSGESSKESSSPLDSLKGVIQRIIDAVNALVARIRSLISGGFSIDLE